MPETLLSLSGADMTPPALEEAVLILIDCQQEYIDGALALPNAHVALQEAARMLEACRVAGSDIIHIAHKGQAGGLFDRSEGGKGAIAALVAPKGDELIVEKGLPNAFAGTQLNTLLERLGKTNLILVGFMTHMCVSSTARAALDLGYRTTIVTEACATRDLPGPEGTIIKADQLHQTCLAGLADRFSILVPTHTSFAAAS